MARLVPWVQGQPVPCHAPLHLQPTPWETRKEEKGLFTGFVASQAPSFCTEEFFQSFPVRLLNWILPAFQEQ